MRTCFLWAGLMLAGLTWGRAEAQTPSSPGVPGAALAASGQHLMLTGTLKRVETGLRSVLFTGDNRTDYPLDISHAQIVLPPGSQAPLLPGMRAIVSGRLNSGGSITVSRLQAFPAAPVSVAVLPAATDTEEPPDVTVRGTVEAVDFEQGSFVLRVNTHTRIVFVTPDTDVSGLGPLAPDQFPVEPGRRVTVGGSLQPNGTLLAGLLTQKEDVDYRTPDTQPDRVLVGAVSSVAGKLRGRDIKLRMADGTEISVQVPHGIPIRRGGRSVSVHDLSSRDSVRVTGRLTGADFHAARIDVLAPLPAPEPAAVPSAVSASSPARPGL